MEEVDETDEDGDADGADDAVDNFDTELDASAEMTNNSPEGEDHASEEFAGIPGVNEIDDDSAEPLEEVRTVTFVIFMYL